MNLSQEEIEVFAQALDTARTSGSGSSSKEITGYDFSHPNKMSKNHFKVLQCVMSSLERTWGGTLSPVLKSEVIVTLKSLEQASFGSLSASLPEIGMLATMSLEGLHGTGYLHLPAEIALSLVDRMTGGRGKIYGGLRALSDVECKVVKRLLDPLATDFGLAWKPLTDVKATTSQFFGSPAEIETDQEEKFLVAGFVWNIDSTEYTITLAIPTNSIYSVRDLLTMEQWMRGRPAEPQSNGEIPSSPLLDSVMLETSVELGKARVSMQDVIEIGVGDVIRLDTLVGDSLAMQIQGKIKFRGRPGLAGNQIAVQITDLAQEAEQSASQQAGNTNNPLGGQI